MRYRIGIGNGVGNGVAGVGGDMMDLPAPGPAQVVGVVAMTEQSAGRD